MLHLAHTQTWRQGAPCAPSAAHQGHCAATGHDLARFSRRGAAQLAFPESVLTSAPQWQRIPSTAAQRPRRSFTAQRNHCTSLVCRCSHEDISHLHEDVPQTVQPDSQDYSTDSTASSSQADQDFVVINFYHLVDVADPEGLVESHKRWVAENDWDLRGRIYYSSQGVNAQYGGPRDHALGYVEWLKAQPLWQGIRYTVWPSPQGHAFPKLRLKYKPNLISLAGGIEGLPVTQAESRATPLAPADWKDMIAQAETKGVVVLDVRNDYEWDAGHFKGAARPKEEVFAETPVGEDQTDVPEPLRHVDKNTPVMMYCTGGIRCDIYSTFLRTKGYNNLYTLEGGIQGYLRDQGPDYWNGSLYVFDGRMAIAADQRNPEAAASTGPLQAAVPCQVCGNAAAELPHVNCANIDCNELFIACASCKQRFKGCCCEACMNAPRLLRPAKTDGGYYGAWGNYAEDVDHVGPRIAAGRAKSEGRVARRARHREALRAKRARQIEARHALKQMMREAMARAEAVQELAEGVSDGSLDSPAKATTQ